MNRLTTKTSIMGRKHDIAYGQASVWEKKLKNNRYDLIENVADKLGELEDKEESYGIDLLTLLNAETVFWKVNVDNSGYKYTEIHKSCECYIDLHFHEIVAYEYPEDMYDSSGYRLAFEDYGKTWSLRKDELENE